MHRLDVSEYDDQYVVLEYLDGKKLNERRVSKEQVYELDNLTNYLTTVLGYYQLVINSETPPYSYVIISDEGAWFDG